jgi:hypothetical protein
MFTSRSALMLAPLLAFALTSAAWADLIAIGAARDNTLYQDPAGALSNGAGPNFFAGRNSAGLIRRGLIAFDIAAAVPAGSTIVGASLQLHVSQSNEPASTALHRLIADWGEGASVASGAGGGGGAAASGDATWIDRFHGAQPPLQWSAPGGDFVPLASATAAASATGFALWNSQQMVADIQGWLEQPATSFGWIVIGDESISSTSMRFDSRENSDPSLRPLLTIEYIPIPSPGVACIVLSGILLVRRRRQ